MAKLLSHNEYKEIVDVLTSKYNVLTNHTGKRNNVTYLHKECKTEFEMLPMDFTKILKDNKEGIVPCPVCTKVSAKHNTCGHEYEVRPDNFLNGKRCPICKVILYREDKIKKFLEAISYI